MATQSAGLNTAYPRGLPMLVALFLVGCGVALFQFSARSGQLLILGLALGMTLYHASFGFAGAYRRFITDRDMSGITAQLIMLAVVIVLFAPLLADGQLLGWRMVGAVAPVGIGMVTGAFLFGIGMQLAGGCASGTLFTAGGGSVRMMIVLVFFCVGAFLGSLHLGWWSSLPGIGAVSLGKTWGWPVAVVVQLGALCLIYTVCRRLGGHHGDGALDVGSPFHWKRLLCGPWPLVAAAVILALLNVLTLIVAGHPWSVTWGYTLWGAKAAAIAGWDPVSSTFWRGGYARGALDRSILQDSVSVMNLGIIGGAALAAALAGKLRLSLSLSAPQLLSAITGGLILGYGARLAYGCNIGAFFSGIASGSLHGWVWIMAAAAGNVVAVRVLIR